MTNKKLALTAAALASLALTACGSNAGTVSKNISKEADQFKVGRRIIVTDPISKQDIFLVEGRCSFKVRADPAGRAIDVICKDGPNKYTKATVGLGDQASWASVQLGPINVSEYRTKIILRPKALIPDLDLVTGEATVPQASTGTTGP